jgi:hypothetical protein
VTGVQRLRKLEKVGTGTTRDEIVVAASFRI